MALSDSQFHGQLTAILDTLLKNAVTDICALADKWNASLRMEITLSKSENEDLKRKLQIMEESLSHSMGLEKTRYPNTNHKISETGSVDCLKKLYECGGKTVESEWNAKGGQWHWMPVLAGIKEEDMEIAIAGRTDRRLDVASRDAVHTIHHTDGNHQISALKTESGSITEHGFQSPEVKCNDGITVDCEDETQDSLDLDGEDEIEHQRTQHTLSTLQHSPTKTEKKEDEEEADEDNDERTEEQEQCDLSHLGTPGLLDHTALFNNSKSTSSDGSVLVTLEGNSDVSTKAKQSNASETTLGHSNGKKKKGPRFICNICGKSLSSKYSLTVHYTLHTGERPYACTQCGKRFVNKTNLQIHQNIHTGAKPYVCTLCPKSFSDPSHFQVQLTAVLEVLMKTAVADICALTDNWFRSLQMEIMKSKKENEELRQKLCIMEQQFPPETRLEIESTKAGEAGTGSEMRNSAESNRMARNSAAESAASRRGHWKWSPILGVKAEMMDRSASERVAQRLDGNSKAIQNGP